MNQPLQFHERISHYHRWGLILAGADGKRLLPLTRKLTGDDRPEQFCALVSNGCLWSSFVMIGHVQPDHLTVFRGTGRGWSDLEEPSRVLSILDRKKVQKERGAGRTTKRNGPSPLRQWPGDAKDRMILNVTQKLISSHLAEGAMLRCRHAGDARVGSTGLDLGRTEVSVQYAEHNLIQEDVKSPDDHLFLRGARRRFGVRFRPVGNGVRHPVHLAALERAAFHLRTKL